MADNKKNSSNKKKNNPKKVNKSKKVESAGVLSKYRANKDESKTYNDSKKVAQEKNEDINKTDVIKGNGNEKEFFSNYEVIIIIIISVVFGCILGSVITFNRDGNKVSNSELDEFTTTYNSITNNYYKDVDKNKLINAAIEGMINYLGDPYSVYMNEEETVSFNETIDGEYKGIGATITSVDGKIQVVSIFENSPASKAGLKPNDIIVEVNGKSVEDKDLDDIVKMIKSKTESKLKVNRGDTTKNIVVRLGDVEIPSVSSDIINKNNKKVGVINISIFAANTYEQFNKELKELEKNKIDSLIIDVRDNAGGHLDQVSKILSLFMDKKKVIYQIESKGKKTKYYSTGKENKKYKISVLVNGSSASASEILAAAMKESYGATIVGTKTYGKGTVQKEYILNSGASIKYTVEGWLTPKGNSINGKGITPNVIVELSEDYYNNPSNNTDNQLQEALNILTKTAK